MIQNLPAGRFFVFVGVDAHIDPWADEGIRPYKGDCTGVSKIITLYTSQIRRPLSAIAQEKG